MSPFTTGMLYGQPQRPNWFRRLWLKLKGWFN